MKNGLEGSTRTVPMLPDKGKRPTVRYLTVTCLVILLLSTLVYCQRVKSLKSTIEEQKATILDLENPLDQALQDLESMKLEVGKPHSPISDMSIEETYGLVNLADLDPNLVIDLRYKTADNFTGRQIYPDSAIGLLRKETAMKLKKANEIFQKDGYKIKVLDAYRPQHIQYMLWYFLPDPNFVGDPARGSKHNRGASADITLLDEFGNELEMGTAFDDFTEKAAFNYPGHTETALKNMKYLRDVMESVGFEGIATEWWHFDDVDWQDYDLLDVGFDAFR